MRRRMKQKRYFEDQLWQTPLWIAGIMNACCPYFRLSLEIIQELKQAFPRFGPLLCGNPRSPRRTG